MYSLLLILIAIAPLTVWSITNPEKCFDFGLNETVLPYAIRIAGCFPCSPCLLIGGEHKLIEIDFVAPAILENPRAGALVEFGGETGDFSPYLNSVDVVCNFLIRGECPIAAGEHVTFQLHFPILNIFTTAAPVNMIIFIEEAGAPFTCFKFPALWTLPVK